MKSYESISEFRIWTRIGKMSTVEPNLPFWGEKWKRLGRRLRHRRKVLRLHRFGGCFPLGQPRKIRDLCLTRGGRCPRLRRRREYPWRSEILPTSSRPWIFPRRRDRWTRLCIPGIHLKLLLFCGSRRFSVFLCVNLVSTCSPRSVILTEVLKALWIVIDYDKKRE